MLKLEFEILTSKKKTALNLENARQLSVGHTVTDI